jgi:hypothetical protein
MASPNNNCPEMTVELPTTVQEPGTASPTTNGSLIRTSAVSDGLSSRSRNGSKRRARRRATQLDGLLPNRLPDLDQIPLFVRNVAAWRGLGYSLRQIGAIAGMTPQALSVMLVRQKTCLLDAARRPNELTGLSPRAVNSLGSLGIATRSAARDLKDLEARLRAQRNCGHKTRREILEWISSQPER